MLLRQHFLPLPSSSAGSGSVHCLGSRAQGRQNQLSSSVSQFPNLTVLCNAKRKNKKYEPPSQNVDLPPILPKNKKKPYPLPLKTILEASRADKKLAHLGIEKPLDTPKNGLLDPHLVPVAHQLLRSWKLLIKGLSHLLYIVPVHACSDRSLIFKRGSDECHSTGKRTDRDEGNENNSAIKLPAFKWRLVIAYDGTRFSGWQYQLTTPTIQRFLGEALTHITKLERKNLCLVGAGRTDAGVHALGQVAHYVTPFNYESLDSVHQGLNGLLPTDIRVREVSPALPEFHARFSVTSKIYQYKVYNDPVMDPLQRHFAYHSEYKLCADIMRDAAKLFVGKHDFSAFCNASHNDGIPNPVKRILRFDVSEMGHLLQLEVEGTGFLYRQVRNMVALLLQVGRGAVPPEIVPLILASRDRRELAKFALSVPPHGLCLAAIGYKEEHLQLPTGGPPVSLGRHHSINKCKLPYF